PAGETFEKIWRLRNEGTCTWTTDYDVIFDGGNIMAGPPSAPLPSNVPPGSTVDIEVSLTAPGSDGTHRGDWKLRTPDGLAFGLGDEGETPFFVQIVVGDLAREVLYDFVANYCDATWRSGAGNLPCPGTDSDAEGFIVKLASPKLEGGRTENEPALITHPEWINNGVISGRFPAFDVEEGDEFHAVIGCLFDRLACDVTMQLNFQENGGDLQPLREWDETHDGEFRTLEVDLSSLAGSSVEFSFAVLANGAFNEDWAFWLAPRIIGTPR
ncbi:MAG: NBR1-Ig-like domain-containing protein, partial [Anaerolineales bacterium]